MFIGGVLLLQSQNVNQKWPAKTIFRVYSCDLSKFRVGHRQVKSILKNFDWEKQTDTHIFGNWVELQKPNIYKIVYSLTTSEKMFHGVFSLFS